ncbi:Helix-turn-helix domain-containing protein [Flavobacterium longum]
MLRQSDDIVIPSLASIKKLLDPLYQRLDQIDMKLSKEKISSATKKGYYRNKDLKELFGFSNNTIIKYRDQGILPFKKFGDVYLYDIEVIDAILQNSQSH